MNREVVLVGSKDRGNKETRKPKTAKKKDKSAAAIQSRVKPRTGSDAGDREAEEST